MTKEEKIAKIERLMNSPSNESAYYELLESLGKLKVDYWDYMTTEPINCDEELKRIPDADFELCTALLTMLLREDHFSNGAFERRLHSGQVGKILDRMVAVIDG